jgi:hypothetical protein
MCEQLIDQKEMNSNTDQLIIFLMAPDKQLLGDLGGKEDAVN